MILVGDHCIFSPHFITYFLAVYHHLHTYLNIHLFCVLKHLSLPCFLPTSCQIYLCSYFNIFVINFNSNFLPSYNLQHSFSVLVLFIYLFIMLFFPYFSYIKMKNIPMYSHYCLSIFCTVATEISETLWRHLLSHSVLNTNH